MQGLDADGNSSSTSNQQEPRSTKSTPKCICGKKHWYSDCFYLNSNAKVPKNWKPNATVQKMIEDTFAKDPKEKETIEKSIQRYKNSNSESNSTSAEIEDSTTSSVIALNNVPSIFTTHSAMSTAAVDQYSYKLKDSWILDTSSDSHLCNDRSRMFDLKPLSSTCRAGNKFIDIEGWGSVTLMTRQHDWGSPSPLGI